MSANIDDVALARWSGELEGQSLNTILAAAAERFAGRIGFATGFGAEGCVVIDAVARSGLAIDLFSVDTGVLFPETYALWRSLEARYGIEIRRVAVAEAEALVPRPGVPGPWEVDADACCHLRKVVPLRAELARRDAWISAVRRDQTPDRATAQIVERDERFGLVKVNPLAAWTARDVWEYVRTHDVPVNPLHERGYASIGCAPCTTAVGTGEDPRAGRWRGRAKTECGLHSRAPSREAARKVRTGFILWFTGLSGVGKTTLSRALAPALSAERPVELLDGDEVRTHLSRGLGFSREDRDTNVRRIGFVARLLARNGVAVVTAAISPYSATRGEVRALAEADGIPFVEIHADASVASLAARDPKGLYRKALAGELPHFTGVSDPYEPPVAPEVMVRTDRETADESAFRILSFLRARGLVVGGAGAIADRVVP